MTPATPSIGMGAFFALPEVKAFQQVQQRNPWGSQAHREAHDGIVALAAKYGAEQFIGGYDA